VWPAELLGRRVGFEPGHAADFLAVAADPRESAEHSRDIRLVIRKGKLVDRESLLPDLERREYR
jgi:imidazolonepropionase-like amidohydrolase